MLSFNSENPYVFNEYFFASTTSVPYEDTVFSLVHRTNNYAAAILGGASILLVWYLIRFRTPTHFKQFSKMLLLCTITDAVYLVVDACMQPVRTLISI
jgi:hypothetical protein